MTSWSIHRSGRSAANRSTEPAAASSCFTSPAMPSGSIWMLPGDGHRFAGQQRPYRLDMLGERGQRRPRVRADLAHPPGHSVAEADNYPGGIKLGHRGDLHRRECGIAGHRRHDAQAHDQPAGAGQRGGYGGDPAGEEAVLGQPQLVEAGRFGPPRVGRDVGRRQLRWHAQADPGA